MTVTDELEVSYHLSSKELSQKLDNDDLLCLPLFVTLVLADNYKKIEKRYLVITARLFQLTSSTALLLAVEIKPFRRDNY